ncbi:MAG: hypothetical protein KTR25_07610 [Myxococcales bacterium]|nr:hypothetical protein [Myxococcales bacterium]
MRKLISSNTICLFLTLFVFSVPCFGQSERGEDPSSITKQQQSNLAGEESLPPPSTGKLLAKKELELEAKGAELEQATRDLEIIEKRIDEKLARLEAAITKKEQIEKGILTAAEQEKAARLAKLVEVTGKMPPESAALYLVELSIKTATKVIAALKSRKGAAILAAMPASKAAEIGREYLESGKSNPTTNSSKRSNSRAKQ